MRGALELVAKMRTVLSWQNTIGTCYMKGMCLWAQIMKAELSWLYYGPCGMAFYSLLLCNNRKFIAVVIKAIIDVLANP